MRHRGRDEIVFHHGSDFERDPFEIFQSLLHAAIHMDTSIEIYLLFL